MTIDKLFSDPVKLIPIIGEPLGMIISGCVALTDMGLSYIIILKQIKLILMSLQNIIKNNYDTIDFYITYYLHLFLVKQKDQVPNSLLVHSTRQKKERNQKRKPQEEKRR